MTEYNLDALNVPIECGPGWHKLIYDLHQEILAIDPDYRVLQVKEKFGGLRYYVDTARHGRGRQLIEIAIGRAEAASFRICENTGGPGVLMRRGQSHWYKTLDPNIYEAEGWIRAER